MKNQYLILLSLLLLDIAGPVAQADPEAPFYIAPDGNDAWSGTLSEVNTGRNDGPLATLEGPGRWCASGSPAEKLGIQPIGLSSVGSTLVNP